MCTEGPGLEVLEGRDGRPGLGLQSRVSDSTLSSLVGGSPHSLRAWCLRGERWTLSSRYSRLGLVLQWQIRGQDYRDSPATALLLSCSGHLGDGSTSAEQGVGQGCPGAWLPLRHVCPRLCLLLIKHVQTCHQHGQMTVSLGGGMWLHIYT